MYWRRRRGLSVGAVCVALGFCAAGVYGWGQSGAAAPPATVNDALQAMSDAAGVIFTGTVTAVRRPVAAPGTSTGVVEIDFAVADRVRGVAGASYTLREWAGLWAANDQPFRVGQRYLMMLHTPNAAGLSSPMSGADGAIPIRGMGPAAVPDDVATKGGSSVGAGTAGDAAGGDAGLVVDLGWVATRVSAPLAYAKSPGTATPITVHAAARGGSTSEGTGAAGSSALPGGAHAEMRTATYASVLGDLHQWEANRAGR